MSRYIDADALIADMQERYCKSCKENGEDYNEVRCRACMVGDAIDDVDGFADNSIDIVRCKECLHSYEWDSGCGAELVCKARRCDPADWGSRVEFYVKADDFCSRGERREP